jgi:repressor LexA
MPDPSTELTARQREVLDFLTSAIQREGCPPTLREIAAHFGWTSDNAARQHLRLLRQKGVIEYAEGVSRGIRLIPERTPAEVREVPLVGKVAAGVPLEAIENLEGMIGIDPSIFPEKGIVALRVHGDSMKDAGVHDGDIALIRRQPDADEGDIVIALVDEEATLKRYHREADAIVLRAENPAYEDIVVTDAHTFEILGVAVGIMRRFAP